MAYISSLTKKGRLTFRINPGPCNTYHFSNMSDCTEVVFMKGSNKVCNSTFAFEYANKVKGLAIIIKCPERSIEPETIEGFKKSYPRAKVIFENLD